MRLGLFFCAAAVYAAGAPFERPQADAFLKTYCAKCHDGAAGAGGFRLSQFAVADSFTAQASKWKSVERRVRNGEMPPKGSPVPPLDAKEAFGHFVETSLHAAICTLGPRPSPTLMRRLNRDEYSATISGLLDLHLDLSQLLPADGAGGEGFDNAAETLFLSPLHSEKYLEAARFALDAAAKEYKPRAKILIAQPGPGVTPEQAARRILEAFLPKAFRRPVTEAEVAPYVALFQAARKQGQPFEPAIFFSLRAVLVSPLFLYHREPPNTTGAARPLDQFSLASRLSYFLWGAAPDELLYDLAAAGRLQEPGVLKQVSRRMFRNDKSLELARRFTEQWLHTRELSGDKAPDAKLFPEYAADEELRGDIRFQPILFFREVFLRDLPLENFLASKYTIGTRNLSKHFGVKLPVRNDRATQPQWVEVPEGSGRGGLLAMPGVLAVTSYPYRTSPVLRGAWILDSILGTPPPPPPPNVPQLEEAKAGAAPQSIKERMARHREDATCAACHSRIDGLGFALENYDVIGRWRESDNEGELADGTKLAGPESLKKYLLARQDLFVRNLANKLLGYALGRGLTLADSCAVDQIVADVKANGYRSQALLDAIILSAPFRQQAAALAPPNKEKP